MTTKPWTVEAISEDELVSIYDTEQPLAKRHAVAMRYVWALRATVANQQQDLAALSTLLRALRPVVLAGIFGIPPEESARLRRAIDAALRDAGDEQ
jgi:hypothetical protein